MPTPAGGQPQDRAQQSGHEIASAIEQGVKSKDLSVAVTKLREEMKADEKNPEAAAKALQTINDDMHTKIKDPRIKAILSNFEVEGYDATNNGIKMKSLVNGREITMLANGDVIDLRSGARAGQRDGNGQIQKTAEVNGVKMEQTVSDGGKTEVTKFSKDGKEWSIQRERQVDGSMRPTKVVHANGSMIEYKWAKDGSTLRPVAFKETDSNGKVAQDYEMEQLDVGNGRKMWKTSEWKKRSGPGPDHIDGTVNVGRDVSHNQDWRDPPVSLTISPEGKYKKSSFENGKPKNEEGDRK